MNFKIIIIILFSSLPLANSLGQSLEALLQMASSNNFELKALENEYSAALEIAPQVNQLPDPEFNAGLFVLPTETRLGPQRFVLGASQMLPWKGTRSARTSLAHSQASTKFQQIDGAKLDILYQVKIAYFELYELIQTIEIIENNLPIFKALESITLIKTENGQADIADVLQVQLKIRDLEQQLKILEIQKREALARLNKSIGRPVDTEVKIETTLSRAVLPTSKNDLLNTINQSHPVIKMYSSQQESAQRAIELNELNGKPTFGLGLDYILVGERDDLNPEGNGRDILIPKVKIKLPINRQKYTSKKQEEQLKIAALENRIANAQITFASMVEQAYVAFENADIKLAFFNDQKHILESIIDIKKEKYSQSGNNFEELLRLENDLLEYDLKILRAIIQSNQAKAKIDRLIPLNN
jgi:outer membrane protein TolC